MALRTPWHTAPANMLPECAAAEACRAGTITATKDGGGGAAPLVGGGAGALVRHHTTIESDSEGIYSALTCARITMAFELRRCSLMQVELHEQICFQHWTHTKSRPTIGDAFESVIVHDNHNGTSNDESCLAR